MADPRDYLQETQKTNDETESRSIEELEESEDLGIGTSHQEVLQFLQQQRLRDFEMQRRNQETESRSIKEPEETEDLGIGTRHQEVLQFLQQQRLRDFEMQRRSHETESRSIKEPEDKEDSVLRRNEVAPSYEYKHSNAEYLQQYKRQRDFHNNQLPQDLPERSSVPICKYFLNGYCKFGSACELQHIEDKNVAEHMYQEARMNCINTQENLQQQRCQIRPTVVSDECRQDLLKKLGLTDFEGSFLERNRYSMMQQQQFAQSQQQQQFAQSQQQQQFAQSQQQHQLLPSDPFEQMQTPESMNTPQPQQHQSLASHPVTELRSHFDECQNLLNSLSRPDLRFGLKLNEVMTELNSHFEEQNHHLSRLLQEREALIEEYQKSVEEIVKHSSI